MLWCPIPSFGLLVIADPATVIACLGDKTHLRNRGRGRAGFWKRVADLGNLTFWLLRRGVKFLTICRAGGVLERPHIRASWNSKRTCDGFPVRDFEAEWIEVAVLEAALSLVEHCQRHGLVRLYGSNSLIQHRSCLLGGSGLPLLREHGG